MTGGADGDVASPRTSSSGGYDPVAGGYGWAPEDGDATAGATALEDAQAYPPGWAPWRDGYIALFDAEGQLAGYVAESDYAVTVDGGGRPVTPYPPDRRHRRAPRRRGGSRELAVAGGDGTVAGNVPERVPEPAPRPGPFASAREEAEWDRQNDLARHVLEPAHHAWISLLDQYRGTPSLYLTLTPPRSAGHPFQLSKRHKAIIHELNRMLHGRRWKRSRARLNEAGVLVEAFCVLERQPQGNDSWHFHTLVYGVPAARVTEAIARALSTWCRLTGASPKAQHGEPYRRVSRGGRASSYLAGKITWEAADAFFVQ